MTPPSLSLWQRYNEFEDALIQRFHQHWFYRNISRLADDVFIGFLLQLGALSTEFVKWYERSKQALEREDAKEIIRHILRDEIPRSAPTHQDDRLYDLGLLGVSKSRALNTMPTGETRRAVRRLHHLTRYPQADNDLRVLITLRIAGEVLVAETYRHVVREIETRFKVGSAESRFYAPHFFHDQKEQVGASGHTDSFNALLDRLITDERTLKVAQRAAEEAFQVRLAFHEQFVPRYRVRKRLTRLALATAASVALLLAGREGIETYRLAKHEARRVNWARFLETLPPTSRAFYQDCDARLLEQACLTGQTHYLASVGTPDACRVCWGDGP